MKLRELFLSKGPFQPLSHSFPWKEQGNQKRAFIKSWFYKFDWLEYSVHKDAAYCFYCYLFKTPRPDNFGNDTFTKNGFSNWKKALEAFNEYVGDVGSTHNN